MISTALAWLSGIRADHKILIIYVNAALQVEGWSLFHRYGRIRRHCRRLHKLCRDAPFDIKQAFTFDQRF